MMKKLIVVLVVLTLILGVFTPAMASVFQVPTSKLNSQFNLGHYLQSGKIPPFLNVAEKISDGLMGKVVISSTGMASLFTWKPNSGERDEYKWNGTSWEFVKTITGIVPGMEEPLSVVSNKETVWGFYLHEIVDETGGSTISDVVVVDNGIRLELIGANKIEVGDTAKYTAIVSGGKTPYTYAWSTNGLTSPSTKNVAFYKWNTPGDYKVTVGVRDYNGKMVTKTITVQVVPVVSVSITGPSQLSENEKGNYVAHINNGIAPYRVVWSTNGKYSSVGTGAVYVWSHTGTYTITVTVYDSDPVQSHTAKASLLVHVVEPLRVTITAQSTRIKKNETDVFYAHPTGGTGNYTYQWGTGTPPAATTTQNYNGGTPYNGGRKKHILPYWESAFNILYPAPIYAGMIGGLSYFHIPLLEPHKLSEQPSYPPKKTIQPVPPTPIKDQSVGTVATTDGVPTNSTSPINKPKPVVTNPNKRSIQPITPKPVTDNSAKQHNYHWYNNNAIQRETLGDSYSNNTSASYSSNSSNTSTQDIPMYSSLNGATATYSWGTIGYHTVWVKVTDSNGNTAVASIQVYVYQEIVPPPDPPYNPPKPPEPTKPTKPSTSNNTVYVPQVAPIYVDGKCVANCNPNYSGGTDNWWSH